MAFPVWRRAKRKVYVYYNDSSTNKLMQLPRDVTEHLDGLAADEVYKWVAQWEKDHGRARRRSERIHLKETDRLHSLWTQYQAHRDLTRSRREGTSQTEDEVFRKHILGFFVGKHGMKLPARWHGLIADFHAHLFEQKLSISTMQKILWTLERFGKHLVWQRYLEFPFVVSIPSKPNSKVTPLKVRKTPEQIIKFVEGKPIYTNQEIDFNLAILLGYFAALGPGELFAVEKSDLLTGGQAERDSKTLAGFRKHALGSKLAIVVSKTLPAKGAQSDTVPLVKNDYRLGVVTVWHSEAAKLIASMVKARPDGRLFPYSYGHLVRMWRENVRPRLGVTPHDLRRASCLYLGRTLRIEVTLLQEHMRHAEIETTMLYMREPAVPDTTKTALTQNFDDVA